MSKRIRLAIVSSHPIQYNAPLFRELAARNELEIKVFFSWEGTRHQADPEFGKAIAWDIPLTDGYAHQFVPNRSRDPGSHHFGGLDNPGMVAAVEDFRPDAVLVYGWSSKTHLSVIRHFSGRLPVFFRGDSTLLSGRRGVGALLRKPWLTWVYRHLDAAFYVGVRNRDYFLAHGLSDDRLDWVPHSIDNDRFARSEDCELAASEARRSFGIPSNAVAFLFAGKLVAHKQPELLLGAFRALSGAVPPHLVIAGSGPLEGGLREIVSQDVRLSNRVHFLGFQNQSQMPATYRIGDVIVLPSSRETWGLTVNEAMASGRPAIVSDHVGCAPDLARDAAFSSVFPSGQPAALTAAMQAWIVKGRNAAANAGNAAAEFIHGWSTQTAAERLSAAVSSRIRHG